MPEQQSRLLLHPKINVNQLLHAINDIGKCKCTVNDIVQDSCTTTNKWHQLAALVWYDCPTRVEMLTLTTLLRLSICHDDYHQHKKGMMHNQHYDDGALCSIKTPREA